MKIRFMSMRPEMTLEEFYAIPPTGIRMFCGSHKNEKHFYRALMKQFNSGVMPILQLMYDFEIGERVWCWKNDPLGHFENLGKAFK